MSSATTDFALARIGQISLPVRDLARAVTFYRDTLGVRFLFQAPPGLAFFDCAGTRLMLAAPERDDEPRSGSVLYFRVPDIGGAHGALVARGVEFVEQPRRIASLADVDVWMAFFHDSEGNLLAVMSEVPR